MLCIHVWGSKLPMYLCVKWSMKADHGKMKCLWGLSADLRHSGLFAIIASSDRHKTHQVVGWLLPSWSSQCKRATFFVGDQLPPCLAVCNLESISAMYFWFPQLLNSVWMYREERRALSVVAQAQLREKEGRETPSSSNTTKAAESRFEVS